MFSSKQYPFQLLRFEIFNFLRTKSESLGKSLNFDGFSGFRILFYQK
jgi:hypothetical protein